MHSLLDYLGTSAWNLMVKLPVKVVNALLDRYASKRWDVYCSESGKCALSQLVLPSYDLKLPPSLVMKLLVFAGANSTRLYHARRDDADLRTHLYAHAHGYGTLSYVNGKETTGIGNSIDS